ncbi:MAG TPA: aminotransferase class I/II-fold pyridoxal phosphate-dependent enzyme [Spirochaetia bacterium]|nr:aminotransferase class I/II-fold pyridoxal phosphate-dependent enzyme [Spirochaetia bacterium]
MDDLQSLQRDYDRVKSSGLKLNMERGQPGDQNFDLSNGLLSAVTEKDLLTPTGVAIRNYPGGVAGLAEARELFSTILRVKPSQMFVGGNSSLKILADLLLWARVCGLRDKERPWKDGTEKFIVTVPGYDRHFTLLATLGFEMVSVGMTPEGPDIDAIERIAGGDASVKGLLFVPTYSNPTGETVSNRVVHRLAAMKTAAPDFTVFADDAYAVHHLAANPVAPDNLLATAVQSGNPDRVFLFGSTSKITFAGAGIGFMATSESNLAHISRLFTAAYIGPNKVEQYRHVKFLSSYPGGIPGLMEQHAVLLRPKFAAVQEVLQRELGGSGLATWTNPHGGYFVSFDTSLPVAKRVVELAKGAGVALTAAGSTYPHGVDPEDRNIRLAPTRPPENEVRKAMEVVALCVKLASAELQKRK